MSAELTNSTSLNSPQQDSFSSIPDKKASASNSSCPISSAPMASAPMVYNEDGSVAWGEMWESFCALASEGGPPHRGAMLNAPATEEPFSADYQLVGYEIIRGIAQASGLEAHHAKPGWLAVQCAHAPQALWMSEQITQENVESYAKGDFFFVPIAITYSVAGEVKNVVTVVAKSAHYWREHLQGEVKTLMTWEARITGILHAWRKLKK